MEISTVRKKLKWALFAALAGFGLLQFTSPARSNPPVQNDFIAATAPPAAVAAMVRAACYDCHSSETRWPWYSRIAPISWTVASDVEYGRTNLNLSAWPANNPLRAAKRMETMSEDIQSGDMPMKKYTLIHRDARLTDAQRKQLTDWLDAEAEKLRAQDAAH